MNWTVRGLASWLRLALSRAGALHTIGHENDDLRINSASVRMANVPAFLVTNNNTDDNVTGDGTDYTVAFDTVIYDQGGDFASGTTFTAPVAGRYSFSAGVSLSGITASESLLVLRIVTSNRDYDLFLLDPTSMIVQTDNLQLSGVVECADMDAGDTATVLLDVRNGSKVVDVVGNATFAATRFSGRLVV